METSKTKNVLGMEEGGAAGMAKQWDLVQQQREEQGMADQ
jgi:hypothetical protein